MDSATTGHSSYPVKHDDSTAQRFGSDAESILGNSTCFDHPVMYSGSPKDDKFNEHNESEEMNHDLCKARFNTNLMILLGTVRAFRTLQNMILLGTIRAFWTFENPLKMNVVSYTGQLS